MQYVRPELSIPVTKGAYPCIYGFTDEPAVQCDVQTW